MKIYDELGLEQGGISSGDLYTIYNGDQLTCSQESKLGVDLGAVHVAAIRQADDVASISTDVWSLNNLLTLNLDYCSQNHVILAPEKTKLMVFHNSLDDLDIVYQKNVSPLMINDVKIPFSEEAEHVGEVSLEIFHTSNTELALT